MVKTVEVTIEIKILKSNSLRSTAVRYAENVNPSQNSLGGRGNSNWNSLEIMKDINIFVIFIRFGGSSACPIYG